jgi:hypothetical protein
MLSMRASPAAEKPVEADLGAVGKGLPLCAARFGANRVRTRSRLRTRNLRRYVGLVLTGPPSGERT